MNSTAHTAAGRLRGIAELVGVAGPTAPCKICNRPANVFGVCDFNRSCEDERSGHRPAVGIPITYHRCPTCGFLFTNAFDNFTKDEFRAWVYNDEYAAVDPDYETIRPSNNAGLVAELLGDAFAARILDYGSGNGVMARLLREKGYKNVIEYDPFVPGVSRRPEGLFDLITAFEVVEHTTDPRRTLRELASFLADPGIIFFSTAVMSEQAAALGMQWWYIGPRNGHASIFSRLSLELLSGSMNLGFGSFSDVNHVLARHVPAFAANRIKLNDPA